MAAAELILLPIRLRLAPHRLRRATVGQTVLKHHRQLGLAVTSQGWPDLA